MIYDLTCFANHLTLMDWNVEPPPQRCVKSVSWKMSIQKLIWWRQACVLTTFKWYFACQQDHLQVFLVPYNIPCITITYRFIKLLIVKVWVNIRYFKHWYRAEKLFNKLYSKCCKPLWPDLDEYDKENNMAYN